MDRIQLNKSILCPVTAILFILIFIGDSFAGYKDDIGYTALKRKLGSKLPDGKSLAMVMQVEAAVATDPDREAKTKKNFVWMPDPGNSNFRGKTILNRSGANSLYSGHATGVGSLFYGRNRSIAPGIGTIESFSTGHWLGKGYLRTGEMREPSSSPSRVANQSWVGTIDDHNTEILRRLDWVIDTDDVIHSVGPCLSNKPLLGSAFNVIAVGRAQGESGAGSVAVDNLYSAGRSCPHLIAPFKNPSSAAPVVAAGAAILIDLGHRTPELSDDPVFTKTVNRNGDIIYNAERAEVIKAALMAGAERRTRNSVRINGQIPNIADYRAEPQNRTDNGLDRRYGGGQLNINNSYSIIAGGEQNSREDLPGSDGAIGPYGFDYDPYFGGVNSSNASASYYIPVSNDTRQLCASLVWNIKMEDALRTDFNAKRLLHDLDLFLIDITDSNLPFPVASSASTGENTENIWVQLERMRKYRIQIKLGAGQGRFLGDYAFAWRIGLLN